MKRYVNYFKYVCKHKWFVLIAGIKIRAPLWNLLIHDLSKFTFFEFIWYAKTFYAKDGSKKYTESVQFQQAWNRHQKRNKHHWEYWIILAKDDKKGYSTEVVLPMPKNYILEMVADWMGAGRAITGKWDIKEWFAKNQTDIKLHHNTRIIVVNIVRGLK